MSFHNLVHYELPDLADTVSAYFGRPVPRETGRREPAAAGDKAGLVGAVLAYADGFGGPKITSEFGWDAVQSFLGSVRQTPVRLGYIVEPCAMSALFSLQIYFPSDEFGMSGLFDAVEAVQDDGCGGVYFTGDERIIRDDGFIPGCPLGPPGVVGPAYAAALDADESEEENWFSTHNRAFVRRLCRDDSLRTAFGAVNVAGMAAWLDVAVKPDEVAAVASELQIECARAVRLLGGWRAVLESEGVLPKSEGKWDELLRLADNLSTGERAVLALVIRHRGRCQLDAIARERRWEPPFDKAWESVQRRINQKIRPTGWVLYRRNNAAELSQDVPPESSRNEGGPGVD